MIDTLKLPKLKITEKKNDKKRPEYLRLWDTSKDITYI